MQNRLTKLLGVLVGSSGLCSAVSAQYSYEVRLVLDNDPILASLGIDYGSRALPPGASATGVGVTLLARVTSTGTRANYGVAATFSAAGNPITAGLSSFWHNDTTSDVSVNGWNAAMAFQRGISSPIGAPTQYGRLAYTNPNEPNAPVNFRGIPAAQNTGLSPTANSTTVSPPVWSPAQSNTGSSGHANGYVGVIDGPIPNSGSISAMAALRGGVGDVDSPSPFTNYGAPGNDQDLSVPETQSPWVGIYHAVFVPRPTDETRDVTVSWRGWLAAGTATTPFADGFWRVNSVNSNVTFVQGSLTFSVPTPGTALAVMFIPLGAHLQRRRRGL